MKGVSSPFNEEILLIMAQLGAAVTISPLSSLATSPTHLLCNTNTANEKYLTMWRAKKKKEVDTRRACVLAARRVVSPYDTSHLQLN